MEVRPGDRVTIHGLASKPALNGKSAILVGSAANGRVTVRLDDGSEIALKQTNLGVNPGGAGNAGSPGGGGGGGGGSGGMPGSGGGMPGFGGGMPGFGGGMPGGMPGMPAGAKLKALVERQLAALGVALPPGVTAGQAAAGLVVAAVAGLWILNRTFPVVVLAGVGLTAYLASSTPRGSKFLETGAQRCSRLVRRPLQPMHLLIVFCIVAALVGKAIYPGGSSSASSVAPAEDIYGRSLREAYQQGYDDGVAGLDPRPPKHFSMPEVGADRTAPASSGGFGMGSMMRYGMVASYFYKAGAAPGGGFSLQMLMANLQTNPMQAGMMLMMLSGSIF
mmetsp:Transcript_168096/g.539846  ORF Transcript_168096/g.539846 Transcript_168096/m.539846 type:complete len:334 (+) Transcript_168096:81-1082(+)